MSMNSRPAPAIPWGAFLFALLGLMWCGYIAFPTSTGASCATSGCALFRNSRIAGISLWWVGGAYFFLLAIVCLRARPRLAYALAKTALILDAFLLLVMFATAPCRDCLVVAVFFGLTFFCLRPSAGGWFLEEPRPSLLLPLWLGLFLGNAVQAADEYVPLWAMANPERTEVRIFFSPSCPACRDALAAYGDKAALYPVEEQAGDREAVMRLDALLRAGVPMRQALTRSLSPEEPLPDNALAGGKLLLSLHMLRNKAAVLRQGFQALPLIQINGMPVPPRPRNATSTTGTTHGTTGGATDTAPGVQTGTPVDPAANPPVPETAPSPAQNGALPWDVDKLAQCGGATQTPCE